MPSLLCLKRVICKVSYRTSKKPEEAAKSQVWGPYIYAKLRDGIDLGPIKHAGRVVKSTS